MPSKATNAAQKISAKEAAAAAAKYLLELVGRVEEIRVEEAEMSDDDRYWLVTLSYPEVGFALIGHRVYKLFRIDARTGNVKSMKIREV